MRSHATITALVLAVIASIGIMLAPESAVWGDSGDVMFYLGSAETFAHGGGIRAPLGPWEGGVTDSLSVPAHYPPGFSIVLGAVISLGATPNHAAQIVRAVSLGLTVGLATVLVGAVAGAAAGALAGVVIMVSPLVVFTHTIVFSEPVFTVFVVATIALMITRPETPLTYGMAAALALGIRMIGVALTGTATLWAAAQPGTPRMRVVRALQAFVPSVIIEAIWLAYVIVHHGGDARQLGWYGPALPLFRRLAGANLWWFWPIAGGASSAFMVVAKTVIAVVFAAIAVGAWRRADAPARRLLAALALVFVLYNTVYIGDRLFMDWPNNFEPRNFSVVDVLFGLALATSIGVWWPGQKPLARAGVALALAAWLATAVIGSATFLRDAGRQSREWAADVETSPLLTWVRSDHAHREIYTNWNARVWRATDRRTRTVPLLYDRDTIAALGAAMARTHGVLIGWSGRLPIFSLRPDQLSGYASPDSIAAILRLSVLVHSAQGTVWGAPER